MKSRLSAKGQVTIPAPIREYLGLGAGTVVRFVVRDGDVVLEKGGDADDPVGRVYGTLVLDRPVDELIDEMRGPATPPKVRKPTRGRA